MAAEGGVPAGWIDTAEAARRLGVKPATLYSYVSRGLLQRRRHPDGRRSLFDAAEIGALRGGAGGGRDHSDPDGGSLGDGRPGGVFRGGASGGAVLIESSVTTLGPDRPYYRGRDALRLARTHRFEEVAEWLWTGADAPPDLPWTAQPDGVAAAVTAQAALPADALPLDRLQLIVTTLGVSDPLRFTLQPEAVLATGRTLIAGMVESLPLRSRRRTARGTSIAHRLWPRLAAGPARPELLDLLEAALVLLADHELAASTLAARVAASVRADPYAVVSAALGVVGGPMHGGASLGAERMLAELGAGRDAAAVIGDRLRRGERIPGFGHTLYRQQDARATVLFDLIRAAVPDHPTMALTEAVLHEVAERGLPAPNVDLAVATLTGICGMLPGSGEAVFAIARTSGWLAHALEEYTQQKPLRLRARYLGPAPETGAAAMP